MAMFGIGGCYSLLDIYMILKISLVNSPIFFKFPRLDSSGKQQLPRQVEYQADWNMITPSYLINWTVLFCETCQMFAFWIAPAFRISYTNTSSIYAAVQLEMKTYLFTILVFRYVLFNTIRDCVFFGKHIPLHKWSFPLEMTLPTSRKEFRNSCFLFRWSPWWQHRVQFYHYGTTLVGGNQGYLIEDFVWERLLQETHHLTHY